MLDEYVIIPLFPKTTGILSALLEMVMEILTLLGNLPRTGCVIVSKAWKLKFSKSIGIVIINATEILPYVKISHENNIFW
jgi:hypothetical protein